MPGIKLLHTSDLHIDWPFEMFDEGARRQRRKDLFNAFAYICDLAVAEGVDGLLIAGDLFHSEGVDRHSVSMVVSGFMKLAAHQVRVVILPGNHDQGIEDILRKNNGLLPNVFVFTGENWQEYCGIEGVTVYGLPFTEARKRSPALAEKPQVSSSTYNIGMIHGSLYGLPHVEGDYYPITWEDIKNSGFQYLALGHFHNYRDCSIDGIACYYPGSPERLAFNTLPERQVIVIEIANGRAKTRPVAIPARPYVVVEFDLNREGLAGLYTQLSRMADQSAFLRLNIHGILNQDDIFMADQVEQQFRDKFFHFEIRDFTRLTPEANPGDMTVRGLFINKMRARLAAPDLSEEDRSILTEALKLGLTVLEGGKL